MKHTYLFFLVFLAASMQLQAQSSSERVYNILQMHCNNSSCHSNANQSGGLDLEGTGATLSDKMQSVYNNLAWTPPQNTTAADHGYSLVHPGDPYRSFLFLKMNGDLSPNHPLLPGEGSDMSSASFGGSISDTEKEIVRQWILFGAKESGSQFDVNIIEDYYNGNGITSFDASQIPDEPDPSEGFQVHFGPYFLAPEGEAEFSNKYQIDVDDDIEVHKIASVFGDYSHHYILYKFDPGAADNVEYGMRPLADFGANTTPVVVHQFADTVTLPEGSAFFWEKDAFVDLNSHYINYSPDKVLACEVYMNVYVQESGIAAQEMKSSLAANPLFIIPNDGDEYTFTDTWNGGSGEIFLWGVTSHTHEWGTDFDIFTLDAQGNRDEHIYDASYMNGDPISAFYGYDYEHPPTRYFPNFYPLNSDYGLEFETSYVNTSDRWLTWGFTSEDEMMLMIPYYLDDTAGVTLGNPTSIEENLYSDAEISFYPNPFLDKAHLTVSNLPTGNIEMRVYDLFGRELKRETGIRVVEGQSRGIEINREGLISGVYIVELKDEKGNRIYAQKVMVK